MKKIIIATTLVLAHMQALAADPLSAIQAVDNALRATSLVDMLAKVSKQSVDMQKIKTVPRLRVVADCGDCKLSNATKMLITSSYNQLAKDNGVQIDSDAIATFNVTTIYGRNSFLRGTLGVLSGADVIRGHFEHDEKTIGEYSISHEMGIDEITQQLGEDLLKEQVAHNIKLAEQAQTAQKQE